MSLRPRPSIRELPGDLLTPVGAYLRIRDLGPGFLLESIERGQQVGRYSFLGAGCEVVTLDHGADDPFAPLREFLARHADTGTAGLPPFAGGVVGHLAYDAVHRFEPTVPLPDPRPDDVAGPSRFLLVPVVVAFDHVRQRVQVIAQPGHEAIADEITERLTGPTPATAFAVPPLAESGALHAEVTREQYLDMVVRAKDHITAGDRSRWCRRSATCARPRARRPPSIAHCARSTPRRTCSSSRPTAWRSWAPRRDARLADGHGTAALRPIAGTRPRGDGAAADDAFAAELAGDEKERAEHMMLVDLARNDLARVCEPGTVRPSRLLEVERYSHVMHLVFDVQGRLRRHRGRLLRYCATTFPAGIVSGAPRRARCRSSRSSTRTGAASTPARSATSASAARMDTCIALRTIVIRDGVVRLQAGGGVVADSVPESEHVGVHQQDGRRCSAPSTWRRRGAYGR